jgi:branched-chain amino acid transport system substrate-binding protein
LCEWQDVEEINHSLERGTTIMNKNTWIALIIVVAVVVGALFYRSSVQRDSDQTIRIGGMLSLTGDSANYGKRSLNGALWAIEQINSSGGISGKEMELVVEDSASSPKNAVSAINKLIDVDNVDIIVGDIISGTTIAAAPVANRREVLLFAPGASHPSLKTAGPFFFRNWTSDDFDGKAMAQYLLKIGVKQVGLLVQKTDYTFGLAHALEAAFSEGGGQIISREEFDTETTDLRTQISKMKSQGVKDVYISAYSPGTGRALKQALEIGFNPQWYATLTVDTPECASIAGEARNGVIFTTPAFDSSDPRPEMRLFVEGFEERFGEEPESVAGHAYDAINILATVMKKVGNDPARVIEALLNVKDFPGVTGVTSFDEDGDVIKGIHIKQVKDGAIVIIGFFDPK